MRSERDALVRRGGGVDARWAARLAAALALAACSACTYEVACERASGEVDCTIHKSFAGIMTDSRQVRGVTGARMTTSRGSKGSTLTGVALTTKGGDVQVSGNSGGMDSGDDGKGRMISEVNGFVAEAREGALHTRYREGFLAWPLMLVVFGGALLTPVVRKSRALAAVLRQQKAQPELQFSVNEPAPAASIYCRSCGEAVAPGSIDVRNKMARCGSCHAMFDVAAQLASAMPRQRAKVPLPHGIEVRDIHDSAMSASMPYRGRPVEPAFEIVRRWFSLDRVALVAFSLVWLAASLSTVTRSLNVAALPVLLLFVAPGLGLLYWGAAGLVNRTIVRAQQGTLSVRHGPMPWPGRKDIEVGALKQLFVREVARKGKHGTSYTYELCAQGKDGGESVLLSGLPAPTQALFFEQQLESRLGIQDVAVEGAYEGG